MKRVGLRMLNRGLSDAVMEWRDQQVEEKKRLRGEGIMKRVGSRMRNKELAMNWAEWVRNYKAGILTMWQNRHQNVKLELEALQMKFAFTTQVIYLTAPRCKQHTDDPCLCVCRLLARISCAMWPSAS